MQAVDPDYKVKYEELSTRHEEVLADHACIKAELQQLGQLIFGSRQERFVPAPNNPSQLCLGIQTEATPERSLTSTKKIEYTGTTTALTQTSKDHPGRMKLPPHLERRETILEPAHSLQGYKRIGEEVTEELEYEPGKLFVNRFVRPKYASAKGDKVVIAPLMERPLPKAMAGPGLLTQIVIDKYVDHLPLYRQQQL